MNLSRRHFIKASCLSCGALGLNLFSPLLLQRQLHAADPESKKKLLFIFQRGGNDGINTLIPRGDSDYNSGNRPSLFIPEGEAIDSGNGFAQFHPMLQPMMEVYNHSQLNGQSGPGSLAVIHRVGYENQSRSHFDSQQFWENGRPGAPDLNEGILYRFLARNFNLEDEQNSFLAAALSRSQMVSLKGASPLPNFRRATDYALGGTAAGSRKFLGALPSSAEGGDGSGLLGLYGGKKDEAGKLYRSLVHDTGKLLGATIQTVQAAVAAGSYAPANGAIYPSGSLGSKLEEAAMLFKRTPVRVLGLNLGGWDTHSSQGQIYGKQGHLLGQLAEGFQALYRDLQDEWEDLLIVTMTEFGRTTVENGSRGTDHAESSVVFLAGGRVNGGIYNCDAANWGEGAMFSERERYLARKTDFRSVFGEIFTDYFGDDPASLDQVIPGYSAAVAAHPEDFQRLGMIRS